MNAFLRLKLASLDVRDPRRGADHQEPRLPDRPSRETPGRGALPFGAHGVSHRELAGRPALHLAVRGACVRRQPAGERPRGI